MENIFPEPPRIEIGKSGFDGKDSNDRPFDVLGRKPMGQKLTDLVDRIDQPLVIALDGEWGSGKSHFLKLWTGAHQNELGGKAKVIYFDAFEHDFLDDPLVSLISRLVEDHSERTWTAAALDRIKRAAFPLIKTVFRAGVALATTGASEVAGVLGDVVIAKAGEASNSAIDQFWKEETGRIAAMKQFRDALQALTEPANEGDPAQKIVFIVDELDRCRPDYALSLLEAIKHFFAVANVHFVLGTNLVALAHSVKARYGSEIDADKYIQKFISLTMRLPEGKSFDGNRRPAYQYFLAVSGRYSIDHNTLTYASDRFHYITHGQDVHLRDVERILTYLSLLPGPNPSIPWYVSQILVGATFLRVLHPIDYRKLRAGKSGIGDIERALSVRMPTRENDYGPVFDDWLLWAQILEAREEILKLGVAADALWPADPKGSLRFEVDRAFAQHADSFSLPSS